MIFFYICILLFLFVSCTRDKQRDTVMLVLQFYIKRIHTKRKKKRKGKDIKIISKQSLSLVFPISFYHT